MQAPRGLPTRLPLDFVKCGGRVGEERAQTAAQSSDRTNGDNRNETYEQSVLKHGRSTLITNKTTYYLRYYCLQHGKCT